MGPHPITPLPNLVHYSPWWSRAPQGRLTQNLLLLTATPTQLQLEHRLRQGTAGPAARMATAQFENIYHGLAPNSGSQSASPSSSSSSSSDAFSTRRRLLLRSPSRTHADDRAYAARRAPHCPLRPRMEVLRRERGRRDCPRQRHQVDPVAPRRQELPDAHRHQQETTDL